MRHRYRRNLNERFLIRFHMSLILASVLGTGVIASKVLRGVLHMRSMALRYALAVGLSYVVFFALVRLWLWYVDASGRPAPGRRDVADTADGVDAAIDLTPDGPWSASGGGGGGGGGSSSRGGLLDGLDIDGEGLVLSVLGLLLLVLCGAGIYLIWEAPVILSEAAFQMVLATSLSRRARLMDKPDWSGSVLRATIWPFLGVLALATLLGAVAQGTCPGAVRLADVVPHCMVEPPPAGPSGE
jgi:hypothetical protein